MIEPDYSSIQPVRDICEQWILLWEGNEWGESMWGLYQACHTSYGLSDEDCAKVAEIMLQNVISMREWMITEGAQHGLYKRVEVERVQEQCRVIREYWYKGGNLGDFGKIKSQSVLNVLPAWMFGE